MTNHLLKLNCIFLIIVTPIVLPIEQSQLHAEEVILQNDSATDNQPGYIFPGLTAHDVILSWFKLPEGVDSLEIKELQISIANNSVPTTTTFGEMGYAFGDYDFDGDVDESDLNELQNCLNKSNYDCLIFDHNFNGIVDDNDFVQAQNCYSGSNIADINCGNLDENGYLIFPQLQSSSVVDTYLQCRDGRIAGFMGGLNLSPNKLHRIPVIDTEYAEDFPKTYKKWIVNKEDQIFAIAIQYIFPIDPYTDQEGYFDDYSGYVPVDGNGCKPGINYVFLYDYTTGFYDSVDICSLGAPGNFIVRVVGEANAVTPLFGDYDKDGDLDQLDFGILQTCSGVLWNKGETNPCYVFDYDRNNIINENDFETFFRCYSGPSIPADPKCSEYRPISLCQGIIGQFQILSQEENTKNKIAAAFPLWGAVGFLILSAVIYGGYKYWDTSRAIRDQQKFVAAARCTTPQEQEVIKYAILLLRDQWSNENWSSKVKKDPLARKCGAYLWDNDYWKSCLFLAVDANKNPTNLVAVQPINTTTIIVDARTLNSVQQTATVSFAEWCHIWNKGGKTGTNGKYISSEGECQRLLEDFYKRHGEWITIHHGSNEGRAK